MQLFIVSNAITFISAFFNSFGLFGLPATKITTKESEIYPLQPPDVTFWADNVTEMRSTSDDWKWHN